MALLLLHYYQEEGVKEGNSRGNLLNITTSCVDEILKVSFVCALICLALFAAFYYLSLNLGIQSVFELQVYVIVT